MDWKHLNGSHTTPATGLTDATISFLMPPSAGTYKFRCFRGNTYSRLAASQSVTVGASPGSPSLTVVGATVVSPGATVQVAVAEGPGSPTDWVGLYSAGSPDTGYVDWAYLNGTRTAPASGVTSATLSVRMPTTPGTYNFRSSRATASRGWPPARR